MTMLRHVSFEQTRYRVSTASHMARNYHKYYYRIFYKEFTVIISYKPHKKNNFDIDEHFLKLNLG